MIKVGSMLLSPSKYSAAIPNSRKINPETLGETYISHWSKSLLVSPDSVTGFSHHFLALNFGIFPEQKMDITLGHDG